jgi:hypothetical protein
MCADDGVCGSTATKITAAGGRQLHSGMRLAGIYLGDAPSSLFKQQSTHVKELIGARKIEQNERLEEKIRNRYSGIEESISSIIARATLSDGA